MSQELAGKVAVVTGAGRNIGRAIALTLAEGGASVLVNARSNRAEAEAVAREIESAAGKAQVHIGDVADPNAVQTMAEIAVKASAASTSWSTTRRCGGKSPLPRWTMPSGARSST
jgi:3-oxoacyl-[acyl-carrier protein] reductase